LIRVKLVLVNLRLTDTYIPERKTSEGKTSKKESRELPEVFAVGANLAAA